MRYVSTRGRAPELGFDDVLLEGLARDGGLYVPESWPTFDLDGVATYADVATRVLGGFIGPDSVLAPDVPAIVEEVYAAFRHPDVAPIREIRPDRHLLELFWGPTFSFKDYALQFVGAAFDRVLAARGHRVTVLGATSGDTGSAAMSALAGRDSVEVVILYPDGRVSAVQRLQMTTMTDQNVHAVAVEGTFDDCQALVKAAFGDADIRGRNQLAAVNSINWARIAAQAAYYAWVGVRLGGRFDVAVPTGNFGNVLAAHVARHGGVPVGRTVVATNANHGLVDLIASGRLAVAPVTPTIAPAMDIAVPSNFERFLFELFDRDAGRVESAMTALGQERSLVLDEAAHARLSGTFVGHWYPEEVIEEAIATVHASTGVVLDPHTAIGWLASDAEAGPDPMVAVATAHPAKFPDAVRRAIGRDPEVPDAIATLSGAPERTVTIPADLDAVRSILGELPRP